MTESRTLVLFDIDGTLLVGGAAKPAFEHAMLKTFGTMGDTESVSFAGKTDPQIARELLEGVGLEPREVDQKLPELWGVYLAELERRLPDEPVRRLDGVVELLDELQAMSQVVLGLVTGNLERGATLKLGSAELGGRFSIGGFGSDHEIRNHLPGIAMRRAAEAVGVLFEASEVVVVGDTPRDVECGRHHGTRTVAVATGSYVGAELERAGADRVLSDFSDTQQTLRALLDV